MKHITRAIVFLMLAHAAPAYAGPFNSTCTPTDSQDDCFEKGFRQGAGEVSECVLSHEGESAADIASECQ